MVVPSVPVAFPAGALRPPVSCCGQLLLHRALHPRRDRARRKGPRCERGCALTREISLTLACCSPPKYCLHFTLSLGAHWQPVGTTHSSALQTWASGVPWRQSVTHHVASSLIYSCGAFAGDLRNSVGISQSFLNRAGFDVFTSGAHRVGEGAGHHRSSPSGPGGGQLARGQK